MGTSESDSMEVSSDSEPPDAKTSTSLGDNSGVDSGHPILCPTPPEFVTGSPAQPHNDGNTEEDSKAIAASGPNPVSLSRPDCLLTTETSSVSDQLHAKVLRDEPKYALRERKTRVRDPAAHSEGCLTYIQPKWFR